LEGLRCAIITRRDMLVNVTASTEALAGVGGALGDFLGGLPEASGAPAAWTPQALPAREGLTIPAQVNYVGKIVDLKKAGYAFSGAHLCVNRYLRMDYLWDQVRVQGGAYGAFSALDRFSKTMAFASYRDPNLDGTLSVYDGAAQYLQSLSLDKDELVKSIIGAMGEVDAYMLPDAQGYTAMARILVGDTPERRSAMRKELLATTQADFNAFGEVLAALMQDGDVAVLGSKDGITGSAAGLAVTDVM
jgi:hypothetical protein